jgi:hypothetical protein
LNIASNRLGDSKLSIKGYNHGKLEIGDWSRIDDNDNYKGFHKVLEIDKLEEFIQEEEVCITTNYRGLTRPRLWELMKERGLKGVSKRRVEIVEILRKMIRFHNCIVQSRRLRIIIIIAIMQVNITASFWEG